MKRFLLFSIVLLFKTSFSQEVRLDQLSPQTYEFVKYGNTPVNLYSGEINVTIPIYTYKDQDFTIPIYLGYNSSGFIPNKRESIVGLNWYLNAGGVITRSVRGEPDDEEGSPNDYNPVYHGLYYGIKKELVISNIDREFIFDHSYIPSSADEVDFDRLLDIGGCETEPDEFSFHVNDLYGKFFFENNGIVRFEGNKPFKIEISDFNFQKVGDSETQLSRITIIDDNGFKYIFGGSKEKLEISYVYNDMEGLDLVTSTINTWHISEITAPNGRKITYDYLPFDDEIFPAKHLPGDDNHYLLNAYETQIGSSDEVWNSSASGSYAMSSSRNLVVKAEVLRKLYLSGIKIDDETRIEFKYSAKERKFYASTVYASEYNQKTFKLDSIIIKYGIEDIVREAHSFNYEYLGGEGIYSRLFLIGITNSADKEYALSYYGTESAFPDPETQGVDYWGFWNCKPEINQLIPDVYYDPITGDLTYTGISREPTETDFNKGLLEEITYPTGGRTEFIYENHKYSQRLERKYPDFQPELYPVNGIAGGARIKKITDFNEYGELATQREYIYSSSIENIENQSSGLLLSWPRMLYFWEYTNPNTGQKQKSLRMFSNSYSYNHYPGESHIGYSEVIEKTIPFEGFMKYYYSNYETESDTNDRFTFIANHDYFDHVNILAQLNSYADRGFNDRSFTRGKLLHLENYKLVNDLPNLVSKKSYVYQDKASNTDMYVVGSYRTGAASMAYKKYYYPYLPIKEVDSLFFENGIFVKTRELGYNTNNYVSLETISQSDESTILINRKYVNDLVENVDCLQNKEACEASALAAFQEGKSSCIGHPGDPDYDICFEYYDWKWENDLYQCNLTYNTCLSLSAGDDNYFLLKRMLSENRIANLIEQQTYSLKNETEKTLVQEQLNLYGEFGSNVIGIKQQFILDKHNEINFPEGAYFDTNNELQYDENYRLDRSFTLSEVSGVIIEILKHNGAPVTYIWGYNQTYPIAKIENATYSEVISSVINLQDKSNLDNDRTIGLVGNEGALRIALNNLRNLPALSDALVTTYTYDPLIGVTSITDPRGETIYYHYDDFNRLEYVLDQDGKVLSKNEYNYQN